MSSSPKHSEYVTVPNQKMVKEHKKKMTKDFIQIHKEDLVAAREVLDYSGVYLHLILADDNHVYELDALNGRLLSYGKAAGSGSYYVPVTFSFDNKGDMIPGSFVEIYLLSKTMEDVIVLPEEALTEEQGLYFVYIQKCEESYKK